MAGRNRWTEPHLMHRRYLRRVGAAAQSREPDRSFSGGWPVRAARRLRARTIADGWVRRSSSPDRRQSHPCAASTDARSSITRSAVAPTGTRGWLRAEIARAGELRLWTWYDMRSKEQVGNA